MKGKSGEFNQISYQNDYIKEKYDRINAFSVEDTVFIEVLNIK